MMRKNIFPVTVLIFALLGLAACGTGKGQTAEPGREVQEQDSEELSKEEIGERSLDEEENAEDTGAELGGNIYVRMDESEQEYKAEDGTVLLTVSNTWPVVMISDHEQAADAINASIRAYLPMDELELKERAKEDYEALGEENWRGYEIDIGYVPERVDAEVISFSVVSYSDMGGAHPNAAANGLNFSVRTGGRLTLADVTVEKETAVSAIQAFLLEETKKEEYKELLYEDYENSLGDILTEDTWYLGKDGLHIIANEYIIAPHVAGIMDFVIPYGEADFLKDGFKL